MFKGVYTHSLCARWHSKQILLEKKGWRWGNNERHHNNSNRNPAALVPAVLQGSRDPAALHVLWLI